MLASSLPFSIHLSIGKSSSITRLGYKRGSSPKEKSIVSKVGEIEVGKVGKVLPEWLYTDIFFVDGRGNGGVDILDLLEG